MSQPITTLHEKTSDTRLADVTVERTVRTYLVITPNETCYVKARSLTERNALLYGMGITNIFLDRWAACVATHEGAVEVVGSDVALRAQALALVTSKSELLNKLR